MPFLSYWVPDPGVSSVTVRKDNPKITGSGYPGRSQLYSSSTSSSPYDVGKVQWPFWFCLCCPSEWSKPVPKPRPMAPTHAAGTGTCCPSVVWMEKTILKLPLPPTYTFLLPSEAQCKHMKHEKKPNSHVENDRKKIENNSRGAKRIYLHSSLLVLPWSRYDFSTCHWPARNPSWNAVRSSGTSAVMALCA